MQAGVGERRHGVSFPFYTDLYRLTKLKPIQHEGSGFEQCQKIPCSLRQH